MADRAVSMLSPISDDLMDDEVILEVFRQGKNYQATRRQVQGLAGSTSFTVADEVTNLNACALLADGTISGNIGAIMDFDGVQALATQSDVNFAYFFNTNPSPFIPLDGSRSLFVYLGGNNGDIVAQVIQTDNAGNVTLGAPATVSTSTDGFTGLPEFTIRALDANHVVLVFNDSTNSGHSTCVIISIAGLVITVGTPVAFNTSQDNIWGVVVQDPTHFVVVFPDNSNANKMTCIAASVVGTVPTFGAKVVASNSTANGNEQVGIANLDATHFALVFTDTTDSGKLKAIVGTRAGTVLTFGAAVAITGATGGPSTICIDAINATAFIVGYVDPISSTDHAVICTVAGGNVITVHTPLDCLVNGSNLEHVKVFDATHAVLFDAGRALFLIGIGGVGGVVATLLDTFQFPAGSATTNPVLTPFDATHFAVGYVPVGGNGSGALVFNIGADNTLRQGLSINSSVGAKGLIGASGNSAFGLALYQPINNGNSSILSFGVPTFADKIMGVLGIAEQSGTAGQQANVATGGIVAGYSGLTIGKTQYANGDGSDTEFPTGIPLGAAITNVRLLMRSGGASSVLFP